MTEKPAQHVTLQAPDETTPIRIATISKLENLAVSKLEFHEPFPPDVRLELTNATTVTATRVPLPPLPWYRFYARWQRWRRQRQPIKFTVREW